MAKSKKILPKPIQCACCRAFICPKCEVVIREVNSNEIWDGAKGTEGFCLCGVREGESKDIILKREKEVRKENNLPGIS